MFKKILIAQVVLNLLLFVGAVSHTTVSPTCLTLLEVSFGLSLIGVALALSATCAGCTHFVEKLRHTSVRAAVLDGVFDFVVVAVAIAYGWNLLAVLVALPYVFSVIACLLLAKQGRAKFTP